MSLIAINNKGFANIMSIDKICVEDKVEITKKRVGTVAFIGFTYFALEPMYGIILDKPLGKNNGTVKNRQYFICTNKYGIFVSRSKIIRIIDKKFKQFHDRITICDNVKHQLYGNGQVKFIGILNENTNNNVNKNEKYDGIWYGISLTTSLNGKQIKLIQSNNKSSKKRMSAISLSNIYNDNYCQLTNTWQSFDGKHDGITYFYCRQYQGLFARRQQLTLTEGAKCNIRVWID